MLTTLRRGLTEKQKSNDESKDFIIHTYTRSYNVAIEVLMNRYLQRKLVRRPPTLVNSTPCHVVNYATPSRKKVVMFHSSIPNIPGSLPLYIQQGIQIYGRRPTTSDGSRSITPHGRRPTTPYGEGSTGRHITPG